MYVGEFSISQEIFQLRLRQSLDPTEQISPRLSNALTDLSSTPGVDLGNSGAGRVSLKPEATVPKSYFFLSDIDMPPRTTVSRFGSVVMAFMNGGWAMRGLMLWARTRPPGRSIGRSLFR